MAQSTNKIELGEFTRPGPELSIDSESKSAAATTEWYPYHDYGKGYGMWINARWTILNPLHRPFLRFRNAEFSIGEVLMILIILGVTGAGCALLYVSPANLWSDSDNWETMGSFSSILLTLAFATVARNSIFSFLLGMILSC